MRELFGEIPDPDAVLCLEPEELGDKLLVLLRRKQERERRSFHPGNFLGEIMSFTNHGNGMAEYPMEARESIMEAVAEAFAWLKGQGL